MYYHGSKTSGIKKLVPSKSLHEESYVYLTTNKVVALIYTVNAIESLYEEKKLDKPEKFHPWYSYGFNKKGVPTLEEYYPNATEETYSEKSGYLYTCNEPATFNNPTNIHCAVTTKEEVIVYKEIHIPNIYKLLLEFEQEGLLDIKRYEDVSLEYLNKIKDYIKEDIKKYELHIKLTNNYSVFLKSKFPTIFDNES